MDITLLCNTGLALTHHGQMLLIDVPNLPIPPFYALPQETALAILRREPPYDTVCGLYVSHTHEDHCDLEFLKEYRRLWPEIPCFLPQEHPEEGSVCFGGFTVHYRRVPHVSIEEPTPPHVVSMVTTDDQMVYITADAALDVQMHRDFIAGRKPDVAFWNSMYLSRRETRQLLQETSRRNYIYHMPSHHDDDFGIRKKCQRNFERYGEELKSVVVLDTYPAKIKL